MILCLKQAPEQGVSFLFMLTGFFLMLFFSRVNIGLENNEHLTANIQTLTAWRPTQSPDDMAAVLLTALSEPPS